MDGVLGDKLHRGRRVRSLSTDEAVAILPGLIMELRRGRVQVSTAGAAGGPAVVHLQVTSRPESNVLLLASDFELCKKILLTASKKIFHTDSRADVEARVKAWVQHEFAGRP